MPNNRLRPEKRRPSLQRFFASESATYSDLEPDDLVSLQAAFANLRSQMHSSYSRLAEIARPSSFILPSLDFRFFYDADSAPTAAALLTNVITGYENRAEAHLLGLVHFGEIVDDLPIEYRDFTGKPLLVLICSVADTRTEVWAESSGGADAKLFISPDLVSRAIHDITIDVLIANSDPIRTQLNGQDRSMLFASKVKFALSRGLRSFYGGISPSAGYVSFASCFRGSSKIGDIRWAELLDLWTDFASIARKSARNIPADALADSIRAAHRQGSSISRSTLVSALQALRGGAHYLLMTGRRPTIRLDRDRIANVMQRHTWHQFSWVIIPATNISAHKKDIEDGFIIAYKFFA